jgi:hypothetical protein
LLRVTVEEWLTVVVDVTVGEPGPPVDAAPARELPLGGRTPLLTEADVLVATDVRVSGQIVVDTGITEVMTEGAPSLLVGQSVTVSGQAVMVTSLVVYRVDRETAAMWLTISTLVTVPTAVDCWVEVMVVEFSGFCQLVARKMVEG